MRQLSYLGLLEKTPRTSWGASAPDLPGCVAVATTVDGALRRIQSAIEMHIQGMREDGQTPPRPRVHSVRTRADRGCWQFFASVQVAT